MVKKKRSQNNDEPNCNKKGNPLKRLQVQYCQALIAATVRLWWSVVNCTAPVLHTCWRRSVPPDSEGAHHSCPSTTRWRSFWVMSTQKQQWQIALPGYCIAVCRCNNTRHAKMHDPFNSRWIFLDRWACSRLCCNSTILGHEGEWHDATKLEKYERFCFCHSCHCHSCKVILFPLGWSKVWKADKHFHPGLLQGIRWLFFASYFFAWLHSAHACICQKKRVRHTKDWHSLWPCCDYLFFLSWQWWFHAMWWV